MKFEGEYTKGLGKARFFMEMEEYQKGFESLTGSRPFPGTLNLKVGPEALERLGMHRKDEVPGFTRMGREFGKVECITARIGDHWVLIIFPEKSAHKDTVEIVSDKELAKTLGLSPGDRVLVQV